MTPTNSPYDSDAEATAELLRQALSAEAAEVRPDPDALRSIQRRTAAAAPSPLRDSSDPVRVVHAGSSRTNRGGRRPSWMLGALGAAAATAAVITAVVVIGDQGADPSRTPAAGPGTGQTDATTATTEPSATNAPADEQVTIYYVGPSPSNPRLAPRLYSEQHTVPLNGASRAVAAVHEFLTSEPLDPDYSSGWPTGVDINSITHSGALTTIHLVGDADLGNQPAPHPPSAFRLLAVQALLATAGVEGNAHFTYNGELLDYLFYEPASVVRQSDYEVRAMVSITSPVEGEAVDSPVTVEGSANVFEANVNWELLDAEGQVIDSGYTMAGAFEWAPFTIKLGQLHPGTYTIRAFESSAETGRPTFVDDKTFTVR